MGQELVLAARENFDRQQQASRWSEDVIAGAVNRTGQVVAVHFGWSRSGGVGDSAEMREDYRAQYRESERRGKRPDLLLFKRGAYDDLKRRYGSLVDRLEEVPNTPKVDAIAHSAVAGIEGETSGWMAHQMKDFGTPPKQHRPWTKGTDLWDEPMNTVDAKLPHIIVKAKDVKALRRWQAWAEVPVFVLSVFPDMYAIGIGMNEGLDLVRRGLRSVKITFDKTTETLGWQFPHDRCFRLNTVSTGTLEGWAVTGANGRIAHGYTVVGGKVAVPSKVLAMLSAGYQPESAAVTAFMDRELARLVPEKE